LPSKHVIHTVGPVWQGGGSGEAQLLEDCYRNCLAVAVSLGVTTIAFPGISTGVYGFPAKLAAPIAVETVRNTVTNDSSIAVVTFCCFSDRDLALYRELLL
ncbi:MAG TPA: macro domain-containing protein, partial [Woeseiaceae bacterium]|nr:macro domain-containing protein [Woeseiaceae bacterium]